MPADTTQERQSFAMNAATERMIVAISEAVSSGFKMAVETHQQETRRSLDNVASAISTQTKTIEGVKEGQNERKVLFAQMQSRMDNAENDIKELKSEIRGATSNLQKATDTVNKGIGAALILSFLVPIVISVVLKLWK